MAVKISTFLQKHYHNILLILYFAIQLLLHNYIYLYGDDYYYGTFVRDNFWGKHLEHYIHVNGRAMVHFLVSIVAAFDVHLFRLLNPIIIVGIIISCAKFASIDRKTYQTSIVGSTVMFSLLSINITRQSVYWLNGSFNYLFPVLLSIAALYLVSLSISNGIYKTYITILVFLASATVEQLSIVTFGGILLIFMLNILVKQVKPRVYSYLYIIVSLIGMCTVIFAPGTFARAGMESEANVLSNIKSLTALAFFTKDVLVYHMFIAVIVLFWLKKQSKSNLIYKILLAGDSGYLLTSLIMSYTTNYSTYFAFPNTIILYIYVVFTVFYVISLLTFSIHYLLIKKDGRILISILLAGGAQLMLIISPVYGYRTLLCSIIILFIPILTGINSNINNKYFFCALLIVCSSYLSVPSIAIPALLITFAEKPIGSKLISLSKALKTCMVLLVITIPMYNNIIGYKTNSQYNEYNTNAIKEYKRQGSVTDTIHLKKVRLYDYGWSYPYESDYHLLVFKMYYGIDKNVSINFE